MEIEHHERDGVRWEVARRLPAPALRPLLGQALEGWVWEGQAAASFRELPFPGIPLILNLAAPWRVEDAEVDSFLAGTAHEADDGRRVTGDSRVWSSA